MAEYGRLVLICGTEEYLKQEKKKELFRALHTDGSMSFNAFSGRDIDYTEVARLCVTVPFLEPVRTVFLEDTGQFKLTPSEQLLEAVQSLPESTVLIFYENETDLRNPLYQLVKKQGEIFSFIRAEEKRWKEAQADRSSIRRWASDYLKAAGRRADGRLLEELLTLSGTDMLNLKSELDKLIAYTYGREKQAVITRADLAAICSKTLSDRVFDLLSAKLSGDTAKALLLYEELLALRVAPMKVLVLLERQFQQAYSLLELMRDGLSDAQLSDRLQIKDWQLRRLKEQSRRMRLSEARGYLELSAELETKVKSGDLQDRLAVEMLLCT